MIKKAFFTAACTLLLTSAVFAAPPAKTAKAVKLTEVKVCPITQEAVKGQGAGSEVVGKYKVFFCCGGCQPEFDKLSAKAKQQKIAEVLKKQAAGTAKPM